MSALQFGACLLSFCVGLLPLFILMDDDNIPTIAELWLMRIWGALWCGPPLIMLWVTMIFG